LGYLLEVASEESGRHVIKTPWGDLAPSVDIFPLAYLIVLYGIVYFLPFGIFDFWRKGEDGLAEWLQFFAYLGAGLSALLCFLLSFNRRRRIQAMWWLLMTVFCLYVAGEEISWGERLMGFGFDLLREFNAQGESNLHNLEGVQNYLHASFMAAGVFLGWLGWRFFPAIEAFPARRFSLYFLIVAGVLFLLGCLMDQPWRSHPQ
jgi:hypothetical protein